MATKSTDVLGSFSNPEPVHTNIVFEMLNAYETEVYSSLTTLEYMFLYQFALYSDVKKASNNVGLDYEKGIKIATYLEDLFLIEIKQNYMLDVLRKALIDTGIDKKIKSIFSSPVAFELYRFLKSKALFVYPELPVAKFINREGIQHMLTEKWHSDYYKNCSVDFLITNKNGFPQYAIEYQGSHHNDSGGAKTRDKFKFDIFIEAGIPLYYLDRAKLDYLQKNRDSISLPDDLVE
jgi:hypothetical protein